jgi:membrane-associated phospholipid phosphatase
MMKHCLTVFILISFFALPVFAGSADSTLSTDASVTAIPPEKEKLAESYVTFNKEYLKGYWTDFKGILTSPGRWDTGDWITAALVAGASVALYNNDTKIQNWVLENKTSTSARIGDNITYLGSGYLTVALVGGMYVYGYAAGDGKPVETALLSVESFLLTGVFVQVIKRTTGRHRPYTGDPYNTWSGPTMNSSYDSFPSGHSSSAFAVASVIATEYDNYFVPPIAYTVAAITGYNRMQHNAHWASDVFVGAAIGYFTGKTIVASHRNKDSRVSFTPLIDNGPGVLMTYRF